MPFGLLLKFCENDIKSNVQPGKQCTKIIFNYFRLLGLTQDDQQSNMKIPHGRAKHRLNTYTAPNVAEHDAEDCRSCDLPFSGLHEIMH